MEEKIVREIPIEEIVPNPYQPRKVFDEEALKELSESIKEHGVFQPIIVKKSVKGFNIIAGERRTKASELAGLKTVPAIVRDFSDEEMMQVALLENLQRKDLSAIEEARTYQKILELDSMTQEELGRTMGKSQAAIANKMRLLSLPDEVQEALLQDKISERHARSLLNLDTSEEQITMLRKIISNRMTVRELDNEIRNIKGEVTSPSVMAQDNIAIVEESGPKVEVSKPDINPIISEPKEEENDDDWFNIPLPPPNPIESLEEDEIEEEPVKIVNVERPKQPESDFKMIDELLKSTKTYSLEDIVHELKNVA